MAKTKDPKGGLTAAGRAAFKNKTGAKLKAGVKKPAAAMTPAEMRRKGSWAVRFYGRAKLPALVKDGKPTPVRPDRPRVGRARPEDGRRRASDRGQGQAPARALRAHEAVNYSRCQLRFSPEPVMCPRPGNGKWTAYTRVCSAASFARVDTRACMAAAPS